MASKRWENLEEIVLTALERDPKDWSALLDESCNGDDELRAEVLSLLDCKESADDFIETPVTSFAAEILAGEDEDEEDSLEGKRIGRYEISCEIGRGGMGAVYLASRADDEYKKQVAIKLVKRGFDSKGIRRRFRIERQILARLDHPNIAKLFDGGTTEDGTPYLVMDYVEGLPITKHCEENNLSLDERLKLFLMVCDAIAYAHRQLIVHRDIKPSNIIVTSDSTPKLLDFGIAKLLNDETDSEAQQTFHTVTSLGVMTPEYASPEQARGLPITTSSDVYSLGVVLYELLTGGARPYQFKSRSSEEIARTICETEPTRPSSVVGKAQNSKTKDQRSKTKDQKTNRQLAIGNRQLKGDLDNIVLMALRKEPERRYVSVEKFSEDMQRHLEGLPVIATKDTFSYRASKFINRNKTAVVAATIVVLSLIAGIIATAWQARVARQERDKVIAEQEKTKAEKAKAERINKVLQEMLSYSNQSWNSPTSASRNRDVTINEMLDEVASRIETDFTDTPEIRAQIQITIGNAYESQGRFDVAEKFFRSALEIQRQIYGEEHAEVAISLTELGENLFFQIKYNEAEELFAKAIPIFRRLQTEDKNFNATKLAFALEAAGAVKGSKGDSQTSISFLREALQIASNLNLSGKERGLIAEIEENLAVSLMQEGNLDEAETLLRQSIAEFRALPGNGRWELGVSLTVLGDCLTRKGKYDEAENFLREGEEIYRKTLGNSNTYVAFNLNFQSNVFFLLGDYAKAEAKANQSLDMVKKISSQPNQSHARPLLTLGKILTKTNRARQGEQFLRQALEVYQRELVKGSSRIIETKIKLGECLRAQRRFEEAEKVLLEAFDEAKAAQEGEQNPIVKSAVDELAALYKAWGRIDLAKKYETAK